MKIEIKSIAGSILFEGDFSSLAEALVSAVKKRANLTEAYLTGADLTCACLTDADLTGADLTRANLTRANLTRAYLTGADLTCACLTDAYLTGAYLTDADLTGANLTDAKISEQNLSNLCARRTILPGGDLIGWKKLANGKICKLLIPTDAKRVGGLIGRKCRAQFAKVLEGDGTSQFKDAQVVIYKPGEVVHPNGYDPDPRIECSNGIHFFITREEAESF